MRSWTSVLAVVAAGLLTARAAPAAETARLVLVQDPARPGCVDETELRSAVVTRLGYDPFAAGDGSTVLVKIAPRQSALVGSVEVIDERSTSRGTREIEIASGQCEELAKALSLSISIAIDPEAALAATPAAPPPAPAAEEPKPPPAAPPESPPTVRPAVPPREPSRPRDGDRAPAPPTASTAYAFGLEGTSLVGLAPAIAFGAGLHARLETGRWGFGLGAGILSASGGVDGAARLRTTVAAGHVEGCFEPGVFEYCGLALIGASWLRAENVDQPRTGTALLAALGARVGLAAPLSQGWSLLAHGELVGVVAPVRAQVDATTIWTAPPVAGGLSLGIRRRFP